jgi:hypothetical protein
VSLFSVPIDKIHAAHATQKTAAVTQTVSDEVRQSLSPSPPAAPRGVAEAQGHHGGNTEGQGAQHQGQLRSPPVLDHIPRVVREVEQRLAPGTL